MKKHILNSLLCIPFLFLAAFSHAKEYDDIILQFYTDRILPEIIADKIYVDLSQEAENHARLSEKEKEEKESQWSMELETENYTILPNVLTHRSALTASRIKEKAKGLISSIYFVSTEGLNIGQSNVTKHYNQTKTGMWQKITQEPTHALEGVVYDRISGNFTAPSAFKIIIDEKNIGYAFVDFNAIELEYIATKN